MQHVLGKRNITALTTAIVIIMIVAIGSTWQTGQEGTPVSRQVTQTPPETNPTANEPRTSAAPADHHDGQHIAPVRPSLHTVIMTVKRHTPNPVSIATVPDSPDPKPAPTSSPDPMPSPIPTSSPTPVSSISPTSSPSPIPTSSPTPTQGGISPIPTSSPSPTRSGISQATS